MANTYTQIYIHIVFAVQGRRCLIPRLHKEELCKYITGIVSNRGQKLIAINCEPDHVHVFVGMKPIITVSDLVRDIKAGSSGFMNEKKWIPGKFNWQEGFGAFSHSHSNIDRIVKYILNQEEHHRKKTFKEEYVEMLKEFAVEYDEKYLFQWIDDEKE
ncbi:MAG: IS200/IS605 family transposase [Ignavibacteriales bacterium]|nr:IS200/IS605 family transposase [Ignavibacteriales bacterium]